MSSCRVHTQSATREALALFWLGSYTVLLLFAPLDDGEDGALWSDGIVDDGSQHTAGA